jgi:3-methyladenine DNA glycosylase AlkC
MEPLKEMFNKEFYTQLASEIKKIYRKFDDKSFLKEVSLKFPELELNQRLRLTSETLKKYLPANYKEAVEIQKTIIPNLKRGYTNLVFPDFVGLFGKEDLKYSLGALKYFTSFGSSEFAIREFLKSNFDFTLREMKKWAKDKDHHVRRLASEGSRPRLPWSFRLDKVLKDPSLTLPILDMLKDDEELYVRKSVANHLNDFSKDHPELVLKIVKEWKGKSERTDWILKHACRTLLKKGDQNVLETFGVKENKNVSLSIFKLDTKKVKTGDYLTFNFSLKNNGKFSAKVRLEYAIYFCVSGGKLSKKVFHIKQTDLQPLQDVSFKKKHNFNLITTRKYYPGLHKIGLIVNGKELKTLDFQLF